MVEVVGDEWFVWVLRGEGQEGGWMEVVDGWRRERIVEEEEEEEEKEEDWRRRVARGERSGPYRREGRRDREKGKGRRRRRGGDGNGGGLGEGSGGGGSGGSGVWVIKTDLRGVCLSSPSDGRVCLRRVALPPHNEIPRPTFWGAARA